jgi:hypothetical protein
VYKEQRSYIYQKQYSFFLLPSCHRRNHLFIHLRLATELYLDKSYLDFVLCHFPICTYNDAYIYCAGLKRLATPSDLYIPLPSIVPFANSETSFIYDSIYPVFPVSSGTTSFFLPPHFPLPASFQLSSNLIRKLWYMVFSYITVLASVGVLVQRLNPQPGGPGYLSSSGLSPSSCSSRETLPVATLPPA